MNKDNWTYVPVNLEGYVYHFNIVSHGGKLIYEGSTSEKLVMKLVFEHNEAVEKYRAAHELASSLYAQSWPQVNKLTALLKELDLTKPATFSAWLKKRKEALKGVEKVGDKQPRTMVEKGKLKIQEAHRLEAAHNEGLIGMPQGPCQCAICKELMAE